jgi:hypothetical protein
VLCGEATNTKLIVFGSTSPTIYRIRGEHQYHYTTDVSKQKDKTSTTAHNVNEPLYDVWTEHKDKTIEHNVNELLYDVWTEHKDKTIEHNVNEPYMMYEMNIKDKTTEHNVKTRYLT